MLSKIRKAFLTAAIGVSVALTALAPTSPANAETQFTEEYFKNNWSTATELYTDKGVAGCISSSHSETVQKAYDLKKAGTFQTGEFARTLWISDTEYLLTARGSQLECMNAHGDKLTISQGYFDAEDAIDGMLPDDIRDHQNVYDLIQEMKDQHNLDLFFIGDVDGMSKTREENITRPVNNIATYLLVFGTPDYPRDGKVFYYSYNKNEVRTTEANIGITKNLQITPDFRVDDMALLYEIADEEQMTAEDQLQKEASASETKK